MNKCIKILSAILIVNSISGIVKIGSVENRTHDGWFKVYLDQVNAAMVPPRKKVNFQDHVNIGGYIPELKIACIQGEYEPIFVQSVENYFKESNASLALQAKRSVIISLWLTAPLVDSEHKTFIDTMAGPNATYGLVIHANGIPEIIILQDAEFGVPPLPAPVVESVPQSHLTSASEQQSEHALDAEKLIAEPSPEPLPESASEPLEKEHSQANLPEPIITEEK